jgi:hypothetical protein
LERTHREDGPISLGRELFDLAEDPQETTNLWPSHPVTANALVRVLALRDAADAAIQLDAPDVELDEAARKQLRALGYLD